MKKAVVTTVQWKFCLAPIDLNDDQRVIVPGDRHHRMRILDHLTIRSMLWNHPAGRCVNVVMEGIHEGGNKIETEHFLLNVAPGLLNGLINPHERVGFFWKLLPNEEFLDGAIRIGCTIFNDLRVTSFRRNFRRNHMLLGNFTVSQQTFVQVSDPEFHGARNKEWHRIEDYLCFKHGLDLMDFEKYGWVTWINEDAEKQFAERFGKGPFRVEEVMPGERALSIFHDWAGQNPSDLPKPVTKIPAKFFKPCEAPKK